MKRQQGKIHTHTLGDGPDVFMVHGWGMHSGVWRNFAKSLACRFRLTLVDLPGHGESGMVDDYTIEGICAALVEAAPERAHWLGWSLGAKVALCAANRYPERVCSLTMMAGSARFARAADWPYAMDPVLLSRFAEDLISNYHETLAKFLGLQTWGLEHARAVLKDLRASFAECAAPEETALRAGLDILRHADLRPDLERLAAPLLILLGARDRLAPPQAGEAMCEIYRNGELIVFENAAHTPFLTHESECVQALTEFWMRYDEA